MNGNYRNIKLPYGFRLESVEQHMVQNTVKEIFDNLIFTLPEKDFDGNYLRNDFYKRFPYVRFVDEVTYYLYIFNSTNNGISKVDNQSKMFTTPFTFNGLSASEIFSIFRDETSFTNILDNMIFPYCLQNKIKYLNYIMLKYDIDNDQYKINLYGSDYEKYSIDHPYPPFKKREKLKMIEEIQGL